MVEKHLLADERSEAHTTNTNVAFRSPPVPPPLLHRFDHRRRRHPKEGDWQQTQAVLKNLRGGYARSTTRRHIISNHVASALALTSRMPPARANPSATRLSPIVTIASSFARARDAETVAEALDALKEVPNQEKKFKSLFDTYSTPISYKESFLDNNAFLVYYTKGFDGPGRGNIEDLSPSELRQKERNGLRTEAWLYFDEAVAELEFLRKEGESLVTLDASVNLGKAAGAINSYLAIAD
jgi:hypothetical protein